MGGQNGQLVLNDLTLGFSPSELDVVVGWGVGKAGLGHSQSLRRGGGCPACRETVQKKRNITKLDIIYCSK